jgi:hypothetical protein
MTFTIKAEDVRDPMKSEITMIGEESAAHCDGTWCGRYQEDEDGTPLEPGPHHHAVIYGINPDTSKRRYPIFTDSPEPATPLSS